MRRPLRRCSTALACGLLLLAGGCSGTRQIQTAPPRPAATAAEPEAATPRARLSILLGTGATPLPDDVQALRFRVAQVWLKPAGGEWIAYPAEANHFEIGVPPPLQKVVLSTRVPAVPYDSLGLTLGDVYVTYDANAGAPLTLPRGEPLRMSVTLHPREARQHTLRLTFEPGASLARADNGRWFFLPFITAELE